MFNPVQKKIIDMFNIKFDVKYMDCMKYTNIMSIILNGYSVPKSKCRKAIKTLIDDYDDIIFDIEIVNKDGGTVLQYLVQFEYYDIASTIIDMFGPKCKPEHYCLDGGNTVIQILCGNWINNIELERQNYEINELIIKMIKTFDKKCNLDHVNDDGNTALMLSKMSGNTFVMELLNK